MNKYIRITFLGFIAVAVATLTACSTTDNKSQTEPKVINPCNTALKALQKDNIQVIQLGGQVKLIMPKDQFFADKSTALNPKSIQTLNHVANLLLCYQKMNVQLDVYSDNRGTFSFNKALTKNQAQTVATYLWSKGTDSRMLVPVGMGEANPIASNNTAQGREQNRRIEVNFQQATQPPL